MEIEERRVLRRKMPLLEAYLRLNHSTVRSLKDQGLIDKDTARSILKLKNRKEKIEHLVQNLDQNATPTTFGKVCYYLEKEFLDGIADEMQVELLLEKGKLPLAEYAVKEAKLLAYKLVSDYEQLSQEDLESIASVLAGRYVVARETAKRQKARTVKEEDQDMKSIQEDVSNMYEELQGMFNPMFSFGMMDDGGDSGLGFDGFDSGIDGEPSIVVNGSDGQAGMYSDRSATDSNSSITRDGTTYSEGNKDLLNQSGDRTTIQNGGLHPVPEEMRNGHAQAETPVPPDATEAKDTKEQKKNFMKMLNERMKTLSEHLQTAVKNYHKLVRERNSCLEVLGVKTSQNADDVSLEEEIKKVLEETGYEPPVKTDKQDDQNNEDDYDGDNEGSSSGYNTSNKSKEEKKSERKKNENKKGGYGNQGNKNTESDREMENIEEEEEEEEEDLENASPEELKDKLKEEKQKVEQLEEEVGYYREQVEQMSKTRQMGYFYLSWYDEVSNQQDRPRDNRNPIALRRTDSGPGGKPRPATTGATTGHSTHSARGTRGGSTKWVYYNPDFLDVGDGYVTLKTDHLPQAWSRESTVAEGRPPSAAADNQQGYAAGASPPPGQSSRASNPTPAQSKRFNSPDFKLPPAGKSPSMTNRPPSGGYGSADKTAGGNKSTKPGKKVSISENNY